MPIPTFFVLFIIFIIIFTYKMKKSGRSINKINKTYWEKEERSLVVRKKSIEDLDYIHIPAEDFPTNTYYNRDLETIREKVMSLIPQRMISFSGKTNADLRLEYGTANFDKLSTYEERYNLLLKYLYKWGSLLEDLNQKDEAILVLELGIRVHTDISKHYILLGKLYKEQENTTAFQTIYRIIEDSEFVLKDKILKDLDAL